MIHWDCATFFSPAKINLTFQILFKREDHYHEISSLIQAVSLGDSITFSLEDRDHLFLSDQSIPTDRSNLIWQAVDLVRKETGISFPLDIRVEKKIPSQAGLGGGSSNAATTLWALNDLFQLGRSTAQLQSWGEKLGSDIPFFFSTGRALCEGRGEKVSPLPLAQQEKILIVVPTFGLSTQEVYGAVNSSVFGKKVEENVLEEGAFTLAPRLNELKTHLLSLGFDRVMMTGSGSGFVCTGRGEVSQLEGMRVFSCDFLSRSESSWYKFL